MINKGHGFPDKYKVQYQVPLVVIQNKPVVNFKDLIGKYYNEKSGRFNTSNNIYVLSELLGYNIADSVISQAQKNGEYIYQPTGKVIRYDDIID